MTTDISAVLLCFATTVFIVNHFTKLWSDNTLLKFENITFMETVYKMLQTLYDFITNSVGQERVHQISIQALILTAKRIFECAYVTYKTMWTCKMKLPENI